MNTITTQTKREKVKVAERERIRNVQENGRHRIGASREAIATTIEDDPPLRPLKVLAVIQNHQKEQGMYGVRGVRLRPYVLPPETRILLEGANLETPTRTMFRHPLPQPFLEPNHKN